MMVEAVRRYGLSGGDYRVLNLVTKNRPRAAEHMDGSWQPPTGMWKNSRKLCFPRRAIRVVRTQFPRPGGSLEISKSNCRTGFRARLLLACSRRIRRSGTMSSPMGLTTNVLPEARILPIARCYLPIYCPLFSTPRLLSRSKQGSLIQPFA
jgi:hypothetical protein